MTFVYVLVSTDKDYYLEQLYISLLSLRRYHPNDEVIILVDQNTFKTIEGKRRKILDFAKIQSVDVPDHFNNKARSRWLKTSMNKYISGSFIFIDCDTVICGDLSGLRAFNRGIYCVLDKHLLLPEHENKKYIKRHVKKLNFHYSSQYHFNSGLIVYNESEDSKSLFDKWHELWLYSFSQGVVIDQTSFNEANFLCGNIINELGGIYNCQISDNGLKFLADALIIHYFASNIVLYDSPYLLADKELYKKIKSGEILDSDLNLMLEYPKKQFSKKVKLLSDDAQINYYYSFFGRVFFRLYKYMNIK